MLRREAWVERLAKPSPGFAILADQGIPPNQVPHAPLKSRGFGNAVLLRLAGSGDLLRHRMGRNEEKRKLYRPRIEEHVFWAALSLPYVFKHIVWLLSVVTMQRGADPTWMSGTTYGLVFRRDMAEMAKEKTRWQLTGDVRESLEAPLAYLEVQQPHDSRYQR